jgi:C-terminal processing protease CtpA/Prc
MTLAALVQVHGDDPKGRDQSAAPAEVTYRGDQVIISGTDLKDLEVPELSDSLGALMSALGDQFGLETPFMTVQVDLKDPHNHVLMTPDGKMFLRYANKSLVVPSNPTNTALMRTLGRAIVRWHLLRTISTPFGLPDGMAEGFAAYITDEVLIQMTGKFDLPAERLAPAVMKYRRLLADLDAALGRPTLSFGLVTLTNAHAPGYQLLTVFREALVAGAGEEALKDIFPESLAHSTLGYKIAGKAGAPASTPAYVPSTRYVLNDIPLIELAGVNSSALDRIEMFDNVWLAVRERYADPSLKVVDWQGAYDTLRPLVSYCRDDVDFFLLVRQLLATLRDPNTRMWSPEGARLFQVVRGVQIDLIENQILVSSVVAGSEGEKAGVKRGMIVSKVDGEDARHRLETIAEFERLYDALPSERQHLERAANEILAGAPGNKTSVSFVDESGKTLDVTLARQDVESTAEVSKSPMESEILPERIGYVKIHRFGEGLGGAFGAAIDAMGDIGALVIDVRDSMSSPQGARIAAECLSKLIRTATVAGNWEMRNKDNVSRMPQRLVPADKPFSRPVILVIDQSCFGTAEVFAVMLKTLGRAKLVGAQTAGAQFEPREMPVRLGRAQILLSTVAFVPPIPMLVEGYGVPPDVSVTRTIADVRAGTDVIRAKAIETARAAN